MTASKRGVVNEGTPRSAMTTLKEDQKRTVRKYLKVIAAGELDIINEICTEEVISCTPLGEPQGHEALKEYEIPVHEAFSDFEVTVEKLVAKDDCVAMRLMFLDTHEVKTMGPLEHS